MVVGRAARPGWAAGNAPGGDKLDELGPEPRDERGFPGRRELFDDEDLLEVISREKILDPVLRLTALGGGGGAVEGEGLIGGLLRGAWLLSIELSLLTSPLSIPFNRALVAERAVSKPESGSEESPRFRLSIASLNDWPEEEEDGQTPAAMLGTLLRGGS